MRRQPKTKLIEAADHKTLKAPEADQIDTERKHQVRRPFAARTQLGRRLWRIRQRILASGQPLLDWQDIENELRERRGEATEET